MSPSSRRAWIEIFLLQAQAPPFLVALLAEGVDRNRQRYFNSLNAQASPSSRRAWIEIHSPARLYSPPSVALLAEGVDRNSMQIRGTSAHQKVALLAEGVDRNNLMQGLMDGLPTSPSSRRAWIEIYPRWLVGRGDRVALLAEGVDRNVCDDIFPPGGVLVALLAEGVDRNPTSSPRRVPLPSVALLAEGVDRNHTPVTVRPSRLRRPPRGGRG